MQYIRLDVVRRAAMADAPSAPDAYSGAQGRADPGSLAPHLAFFTTGRAFLPFSHSAAFALPRS